MKTEAKVEGRIYSASLITDYLRCPRLFYYRWIRKLSPLIEPPPLTFGRLMHESLLHWYRTGNINEAIDVFKEWPKESSDTLRTRERAEVIMKEYVKRYGQEPYLIQQMEVDFCVDMGEGRMYVGRIDQIVEWDGQLFVKDHKTTSSLGLLFYRSFRPSVQIDGYVYACRELCGGCSGAIINGISTANNPKERFGRSITSRTNGEIDRFREMFHLWCGLIEVSVVRKEFPMFYTSCNQFGQCLFWQLCVYGEDERTVEMQYRKEE